jgi:hypothetical protein
MITFFKGGATMPDKGTNKKLTRVEGGEVTSESAPKSAPVINKGKAKTFRIFAILSWVVAIAFEIMAILLLKNAPENTTGLIVLIVVDLIFAVIGNLLWKKANRMDPASEKDKARFFIQNQLGAFISMIAFLPLVILIFTNKNTTGKQKGIAGAIAVIALLIAGTTGVEFNPVSQEEIAAQTSVVEAMNNGNNWVYWTKSGTSYHLYQDCSYINSDRTNEIFQGTV